MLGAPLPRYTSGASLSGCSCQQSTATACLVWAHPPGSVAWHGPGSESHSNSRASQAGLCCILHPER